jgi:hypothetical protein
MTPLRIHLEDHGQDFHTFTLRDGKICEANLQGWCWNGARVLNETIGTGTILRLADDRFNHGQGGELALRYPVRSVFMAPDQPNAAPRHSRNVACPGAHQSSPGRAGDQGAA